MPKEIEFWDEIVRQLPVCVELEKNFQTIRQEFISYMGHTRQPEFGNKNYINYPNLKVKSETNPEGEVGLYSGEWDVCFAGTNIRTSFEWGNYELIEKIVKWKTKLSVEQQIEYAKNKFKTFNSIVDEHADKGQCTGAVFSIIKPGTVINPHNGSNNTMRCHMGVLNDDRCTITVGSKTRTWTEGGILAFKDGPPYLHSVEHRGESDRVVLIFNFDIDYLRKKFPKAGL